MKILKVIFKIVLFVFGFILFYPLLAFQDVRKEEKKKSKDGALVLGYPANEDGSPSPMMKSRVDQAVKIYKQGLVSKIIMSGGAAHNDFIEAEVMKQEAIRQGVKDHDILVEGKAKNTYENLLYSYELMQEHQLETMYIISNRWHLRRAQFFVDKFNVKGIMMACPDPEGYDYFDIAKAYIYEHVCMIVAHYYEVKIAYQNKKAK